MNKIKLSQLEMLVEVVDAGSFSAAAAELGCAQSRISHAISELENHLGVRLLNRSRNGCTPTDAGNRVLLKIRQALRLVDSVAASAAEENEITGHVRIASFRGVGTHLLPYMLDAMSKEYPGIQIDIIDNCTDSDDVTKALDDGRAEIGIGCFPVAGHLLAHAYFYSNYTLLIPSTLKLHMPVSWQQVNDIPYIQAINARANATLEQCRADGFKAKPAFRLASDSSITAMVSHGHGFSIVPRLAAFPVPEGVDTLDLPTPLKLDFAIMGRPEIMRQKAVKIVLRFLRDKRIISRTKAFRSGVIGLA